MLSATITYIFKSNTARKLKEGILSPNTLSLHVNYSLTFFQFSIDNGSLPSNFILL